MTYKNFIKTILLSSATIVVLSLLVSVNPLQRGPQTVQAQSTSPRDFTVKDNFGNDVSVNITPQSDVFDNNGVYSVTYLFTQAVNPNHPDVTSSFEVAAAIHKCKEGNGNDAAGSCSVANPQIQNFHVDLNDSNNHSHSVTLNVPQDNNQKCGSIQIDLDLVGGTSTNPNHPFGSLAGSIVKSGVNCVEPTPTPTATPSHTPTPTPSHTPSPTPTPTATPKPSSTPSTVQCPVGKIEKIENSTVVCVSQNQENNQTQNNTQIQSQSQGSTTSSSSSSSSSDNNITINNPTPTIQVLGVSTVATTTTAATPKVVTQVEAPVKELPKTGLPLAGVAISSLLPVGLKLKKFSAKSESENIANFLWEKRELGK